MQFQGKGLFVYSDPGAAKAILAQVVKVRESLQAYKIFSDRDYPFSKAFGVDVEIAGKNPKEIFDSFQPDFLFCGTSYTSNLELMFIREALHRNIPSNSYIDHYVLFKKRFEFESSMIYPDKIFVIDERASKLAIADGIPENKIQVFGNPYYDYLGEYKPQVSRDEFFDLIGIKDHSKKLVVFAPEPLSNINGKEKYGFDEVDAFAEIQQVLDEKDYNCHFIFKQHPNQDMEKLKNRLSEKFIILDPASDTNTLMFYSDIIVGFFSNFLIEAAVMKKKILRLQLMKVENDPIKELNIGTVVNIKSMQRELECLN